MRILHYIDRPEETLGGASRFVTMLTGKMSQSVENEVIDRNISIPRLLKLLKQFTPDVVTIHACWSMKAAIVNWVCRKKGFPVVTLPHGGLMPNQLNTQFWKQKLPRILLYQWAAIRNSYAVVATTSSELNELRELGWRRRIIYVRNPYAIDTIQSTEEESAESMRMLYQKIADTSAYLNLTDAEEQAFRLIFYTSTISDGGLTIKDACNLHDDLDTERQQLQHLSQMEWMHILLAAKDRGVEKEISEGVKLLNLTPPISDVPIPARFPAKHKRYIRVNTKARKLLGDVSETSVEYRIAMSLCNLSRCLTKQQCESDSFRIWKELSTLFYMLRFDDYDEEGLRSLLTKLKITNFSRRMMHLLQRTMMLTQGFMPVEPLEDKETKRLYDIICHEP